VLSSSSDLQAVRVAADVRPATPQKAPLRLARWTGPDLALTCVWRLFRAFVIVVFACAITASTATPGDAGEGCRYWVMLAREGFPSENFARVCDIGEIVDWLRAIPGATVSAQAPPSALVESFTVTIGLIKDPAVEALPPEPGMGKVLLTERVYPVAESGPVAFVPTRSIFHGPGQYPRWVVRPGWRSLNANKPVPTVLTRLGMLQPASSGRTTPAATTPTAIATVPATGSGRPGPDLVTILFLVAILVSVGALVRRNVARTHQSIDDGLAGNSESRSGHG
jgi:hypothetical protein